MQSSFIDLIINDMGFIVAVILIFLSIMTLYFIFSKKRKISEHKKKNVMLAFVSGIVFLISALILSMFIWLATNPATKPATIDIEIYDIKKITAVTQMTDSSPTVIDVPEKDWEELLTKINSLSAQKIDSEDMNGWEYSFTITYEDESTLQIIFRNEKVKVGDSYYLVTDYNKNDFMYVFKY